MDHERLPGYVPQLCEWCVHAVEVTRFGERIVVTSHWPGSEGARVYLHHSCAVIARNHRSTPVEDEN